MACYLVTSITVTCLLLSLASPAVVRREIKKSAAKGNPNLVKEVPDILTDGNKKYYSVRNIDSLEKKFNREGFDDDGFLHNESHFMSDPSAITGDQFSLDCNCVSFL